MPLSEKNLTVAASRPYWWCQASRVRRWLQERKEGLLWTFHGRPVPPPAHVKRAFLRAHARRHGLRVFIETGTLYGDTLAALRNTFDILHSIELSRELYERASARFAGDARIQLWYGDSGDVLPRVLEEVRQPALFWLDGHYSGDGTAPGVEDTPICRELSHISKHPLHGEHLVVIDDARCFNGQNGYPHLSQLKQLAHTFGFTEITGGCDCIVLG
jgi:hypothetical protein